MTADCKLFFGKGNKKLGPHVHTFSLPAGYACPGANECLSRANKKTGKIKDGPNTKFRCFSASQEAMFPAVRASRWANFQKVQKCLKGDTLVKSLIKSLPLGSKIVRMHVAGDFVSLAYLDAWLEVARQKPDIVFYGYTKSIPFWLARLGEIGDGHTPGTVKNFVLTASIGSKYDNLILKYKLRNARVIFEEKDAVGTGLEVDHDDTHAQRFGPDFLLALHSTQPAQSLAAVAWEKERCRRIALKVIN